ncbi:hypothetical protein NP233_g6997 [Leucocoprinus birnbaumii]|uniref:Uncharacterized protein n=1 Tax=Leucocoprinus birnbaumii TaxID=56174 RepID=A0AAD5YV76_9AGAR|nr:hypothetical protein NP233_g6997 [Leucocoprinus birnbaumii]
MAKKNAPGRGGTSGKRGRGRGRGASSRGGGRLKDLSAGVSSLSLEDRPESAVDGVEDNESGEDGTSTDSGAQSLSLFFNALV